MAIALCAYAACVDSTPAVIPTAGASPTRDGQPIGTSRDKAAANAVVARGILGVAWLPHH